VEDAAEITPAELAAALAGPVPPLVLDVRDAGEWAAGHLAGARHVPLAALEGPEAARAAGALDAGRVVVTVCAAGVRSRAAARRLAALGVPRVVSLAGGIAGWRAAGGSVHVEG
jgi:rhodanese-related sulfurtransferase